MNPNEPVYYQNLATTVYLYRKDAEQFYGINEQQVFDKALALYRKAMQLDPDNFPLATDYAQSYYGIRPLRTNDALVAWTNALQIAHDDIEREGVYIHLARIKIAAGRFDEARAQLDAVTNCDVCRPQKPPRTQSRRTRKCGDQSGQRFRLTLRRCHQRVLANVARRREAKSDFDRIPHPSPPTDLRLVTLTPLISLCVLASLWLNCFSMSFYDKLKFDSNGLIPAIIQEQKTGRVLMMAWMNRASLEKTIATGKTHFWSRSRQKFWMKGEESGHTQTVKDIAFDCDGDTLLIQVEQIGAACHEGYQSCFFRSVENGGESFKITEPQLETPEQIYGKK